MRGVRGAWAIGLSAAALAVPASAAAATTFGSDLPVPTAGLPAGNQATNVNQPAGTAAPAATPVGGVLVRIRLRHGATNATPGSYAFRILSGSLPNFTARPATASGADEKIPFPPTTAARIATYVPTDADGRPTGIPIAAGERLAIWNSAGTTPVSIAGVGMINFLAMDHVTGPQGYGSTLGHMTLQGVVEPDADGDKYGDETQDDCPTDAARLDPCPVAPTPNPDPDPGSGGGAEAPDPPPDACPANDQRLDDCTPPVPQITGAPKAKTPKKKATFQFSADETATFECALDKGGDAPCSSPQSYKGLAKGKHTFAVRATDGNRNVSAPVTHRWTVKPKKR